MKNYYNKVHCSVGRIQKIMRLPRSFRFMIDDGEEFSAFNLHEDYEVNNIENIPSLGGEHSLLQNISSSEFLKGIHVPTSYWIEPGSRFKDSIPLREWVDVKRPIFLVKRYNYRSNDNLLSVIDERTFTSMFFIDDSLNIETFSRERATG